VGLGPGWELGRVRRVLEDYGSVFHYKVKQLLLKAYKLAMSTERMEV
jgi:hypothetical protein